MIRRFIIVLFLLIIGRFGAWAQEFPFSPGEKLTFDLKWSGIRAGKAVMEVLPIETLNDVKVWHFVLTAETSPYLDVLYKVRDRIDAYADISMTRSILYKKKQREGKSVRDITVEFDWEKQQARYTNFDEKRDPIPISPGTFDPLSAFYYTRLQDIKENSEIIRPITDGKACIPGRASVAFKDVVKLPFGSVEAYVLHPELKHVSGVFEKTKDATIEVWISADKRRIPLKVKSKVVIGSFTGELVSIESASVK